MKLLQFGSIKLIGKRKGDARTYNLPSVDEVAGLIVGDLDESLGDRDLIIETQSGDLQRINELNAAYLGLQYPLLFPFGEDGYREDIPLCQVKKTPNTNPRKNVSMREYFAYRMHERELDATTILSSKRLFQQFLVDAYTMVESSRLAYIRQNQKKLRCEMYKGLADALIRSETNPGTRGKRIILPSTFTGGARYMVQNYQDAMAICKWVGYPNLFITFTCNPKWPEIKRYVESRQLRPEDRPDIVCRVFKMKLDSLIKDLRKGQIFGNVKAGIQITLIIEEHKILIPYIIKSNTISKTNAVIYTIEFQKRGLPHAHILLFLSREDADPSPEHINKIISAEIPDKQIDPNYYTAVQEYMMHGPCGNARKTSPCMSKGKCTKYFPKKFSTTTTVDEDGYPSYRRNDNGRIIIKNGVPLDNRYVVPHNRELLMKYGAHINVEWCNQSRSIKYLFKYINKGTDRVTATFYKTTKDKDADQDVDEVKMYYDCRYISPCEAAWRIFGYDIQYRKPAVERLSFHLPNEQNVIFTDSDPIDEVLSKPTVNESMFLSWFEANKIYAEARELTYSEFPTKFVWKHDEKSWRPRKKGYSIGRIFYVPPGSGEKYYLRCLLTVVRGPTCYEDIRTVNGVVYKTFKEACYALGLLNDDKEYIDSIVEASQWASAASLRNLFVTLLSTDSMGRANEVWNSCWKYLSDDILYYQRAKLNQPGKVYLKFIQT